MGRSRLFGRSLRSRGSIAIGAAFLLVTSSAALAAGSGTSKPVAGGRYVGHTSQNLSVNLTVAHSGAEFSGGNVYVRTEGTCSGVNPITFAPTPPPAVKINSHGHFAVAGTYAVGGDQGRATAQGQFTDNGNDLHGIVTLAFTGATGQCSSGTVTFTAKLKR